VTLWWCFWYNWDEKSVTQTDMKNLHKQFVQLGRQRNQLTYKLLALLPEINEKKIYLKHGCNSIVEYAGKFGGLSRDVVKKALKVHKDVEDKPHLKAAIEKVGVHKVALISKVSTKENEKVLAETVENSNRSTVVELSKELRNQAKINSTNIETAKQKIATELPKCQAAPSKLNIDLDEESQFLFLKLKKKLGETLNNKEALKKMLRELAKLKKLEVSVCDNLKNKNEHKPQRSTKQQKQKSSKYFPGKIFDKNNNNFKNKQLKTTSIKETKSRYIPVKIRKEALSKTKGKCAYPNCNKPADLFHHRERFSEIKNHSSIIPLCKCHHEFAHNGLIKNEQQEPEKWQLAIPWSCDKNEQKQTIQPQKSYADTFYLLHKQGAF